MAAKALTRAASQGQLSNGEGGSRRNSSEPEELPAIPQERSEAESKGSDEAKSPKKGDEENDGGPEVEVGNEINTKSFQELQLPGASIQAAQESWKLFVASAGSNEAAGEAIYSAIFESAPSLQSLFVTPRAVQAMRFMNGLAGFIRELDKPDKLKVLVETLGFGHLHLDVTTSRVVIFRDAILDLFSYELGDRFTNSASDAWRSLLNYIGGAIIYVKAHYAQRIEILLRSWKICNSDDKEVKEAKESSMSSESREKMVTADDGAGDKAKKKKSMMGGMMGKKRKEGATNGTTTVTEDDTGKNGFGDTNGEVQNVPKTFPDMFLFNAAVMGFGNSEWMVEVLDCFNDIVENVSNSARLQQECAILSLRIAKKTSGPVNLTEYKSCMMASLRSLLPKDWDSAHEVAWSWLWDNVERLLSTNQGKPLVWEKALGKFLDSLDEDQKYELRKEIYLNFFTAAPAGQDFFKQSNTYLHFIAERILNMTTELYRDPPKIVDDLSALGLRHVGYGIPVEFFGPFVTACVTVIRTAAPDDITVEAYSFSLNLISSVLTRTITEGSTVVMKAININTERTLKKAISCAPRGERAKWLLMVQVGTQNISPLSWSLESGSLEATVAIIRDLLTIRADRERYYYGLDELFKRHPDIINRICTESPAILPILLDGLIWRSAQTENNARRVNYYVNHLLMDEDGNFNKTVEWVHGLKDPKIVCHPVMVLVLDLMWNRVVWPTFFYGKTWFLFTLMLFVTSQSVLEYINDGKKGSLERGVVFGCRMCIYLASMTQLVYSHARDTFKAFRNGSIFQLLFFWVPAYLKQWQEAASFFLAASLLIMLSLEPIAQCWNHPSAKGMYFYAECDTDSDSMKAYEFFSLSAMFLYYTLLIDFAAVSTKVSSYVLICFRMGSEVFLFLGAVAILILAFSSAISVMEHDNPSFAGIPSGSYALSRMTLGMFDASLYEALSLEPTVHAMATLFIISVSMFLTSLFIAQLSCAYSSIYIDMLGYARLERSKIIVEMMPDVPKSRWVKFIDNMNFSTRLEFNAGDVGLAGGIQVRELASINPTTMDTIKRYGGTTASSMQWPADDEESGENVFDRIERLMTRTLKRVTSNSHGKKGKHGTSSGSGGPINAASSSSDASGDQESC